MPEDWSKLRDIDPLADAGVRIEFSIPLSEFPRLRAQLAHTDGLASGSVRFGRRDGAAIAHVHLSAIPGLRCQRCLEPMRLSVSGDDTVALVADDAEAGRAPAGLDTVLAPGHRLSVRDLAEEELLLSLPLVALHAEGQCAPQPAAEAAPETGAGGAETQRPFERLGELLRRDK